MKAISDAFKAHLAGDVTTLATCWKATLTNGTVLGFTDHTRNITFAGQLYKSSTGYTPTAVETSSMLSVDNLEVEAVLNSGDITEGDLLAGKWDNATVEMFWVNWNDLTMGKMVLKTGTLGQIVVKETSFVAEVRGLTQAYATVIGELTSPMCRAKLGDSRCTVNVAPLTVSAVVNGIDVTNRVITTSSLTQPGPTGGVAITGVSRALRAVVTTAAPHGFASGENIFISGVSGVVQAGATDNLGVFQPGSGKSINGYTYGIADVTANSFSINLDTRLGNADATLGPAYGLQYTAYAGGGTATPQGNNGYFDYGIVKFTSGLNVNLSMEVKSYVPGTVELQLPMPYPVAVGDAYTIQPGCGKRFIEDCKTKFNNVINFRGEPHLPGVDQLLIVGNPPTAV